MTTRAFAVLALVLAAGISTAQVHAQGARDGPLARPAALEPDIAFWRRIYTEVTTEAGLVHDNERLDIVYAVLPVPKALSPGARRQRIEAAKGRYVKALARLANGHGGELDEDAALVKALWGDAGRAELRAAAERVRFQLGQADRFREGLVRSGAWIDYIRATFEREGLPTELAALPHVESSFNTYAYSKVGAAGMWQFMPGTGRRYMRIDNVVDERLDPYRATEAAAQFLAQNHAVLNSWPLAITAYNHGTAGMRRAREQLGTDDIATIVRRYRSRTFGFASRNFYVAFLAASEIDRTPEKYFPEVRRVAVDSSRVVVLPHYLPAAALASALDLGPDALRLLNPSLLDAVWNGSRYIPRGHSLRIPPHLDFSAALDRIPARERYAAQVPDTHHTVRRGDTLSGIASRYDIGLTRLAALNGLRPPYRIRAGQRLVLPDGAGEAHSAQTALAASPGPAGGEYVVRRGDTLSSIAAATGVDAATLMQTNKLRDPNFLHEGQVLAVASAAAPRLDQLPESVGEPVGVDPPVEPASAIEAVAAVHPSGSPGPASEEEASGMEELGPSLVPGAGSAATADPADYSVAADGTIRIEAAETLGHYAEWLDLRASRLRELNGMRYGAVLSIGRRLQLDLSRVTAAEFEARRVAHHRALQAQFFSEHHIAGSEMHMVRAGESVWVLAQRQYGLPLWLLRQYNPDVDLGNLRPGTRLTIPRVEPVTREAS